MAGSSLSNQPRTVIRGTSIGTPVAVSAAGTYVAGLVFALSLPTAQSSNAPFYLNPADWEVYSKELLFAVRLVVATADVNPALTAYGSLFPVTGLTGSGTGTAPITLGPELAGSRTPSYTTAADTISPQQDSAGFTVSSAGLYVPAVTVSAAMAANSRMQCVWSVYSISR